MASEILDAFIGQDQERKRTNTFRREPHHDLESLCLVIIYSLFRRVYNRNRNDSRLKEEFTQMFGQVTLNHLVALRKLSLMEGKFTRLNELLAAEHPILRRLMLFVAFTIVRQLPNAVATVYADEPSANDFPIKPPILITHDHLDDRFTTLLAEWKQTQ